MELNQCLLSNPREISGSVTSRKYDYQKDWSIYQILELLKTEKDFVALFDYHEDFIVIDLNNSENNIDFYQIKCVKKVNWTKKQIIKRDKGKKGFLNSILGKLVNNVFIFDKFVNSLNFVSNSPLKLKMSQEKDSKNMVSFKIGDSLDKEEICLEISKELEKEKDLIPMEKIYFLKTNLNEDGSETYVLGKLGEFLSENYPELASKLKPLYQTLFREVRIKSNNSESFENLEELFKKKGISRKEIMEIFLNLEPERTSKERWNSLENRMNFEGWDLKEILEIKEKWQRYSILIKDRSNYLLKKIREKIVEGIKKSKDSTNLNEVIKNVKSHYEKCKEENEDLYLEYIPVCILFEYYG